MDKRPSTTVRVDETGALVDVDVEGHPPPGELIETKQSAPIAPFGDEEYKGRVRPWLVGG